MRAALGLNVGISRSGPWAVKENENPSQLQREPAG